MSTVPANFTLPNVTIEKWKDYVDGALSSAQIDNAGLLIALNDADDNGNGTSNVHVATTPIYTAFVRRVIDGYTTEPSQFANPVDYINLVRVAYGKVTGSLDVIIDTNRFPFLGQTPAQIGTLLGKSGVANYWGTQVRYSKVSVTGRTKLLNLIFQRVDGDGVNDEASAAGIYSLCKQAQNLRV
jgi:hypothetical protein